jgi:hypothetical protein
MRGTSGISADIQTYGTNGGLMSQKLGEVSLYKAHLLLIQKKSNEMYEMAGHYLKNVSSLGEAESFVVAVLNMSKEIFHDSDIDRIRDEIVALNEKSPCEAPEGSNRRSLYPPDTESNL